MPASSRLSSTLEPFTSTESCSSFGAQLRNSTLSQATVAPNIIVARTSKNRLVDAVKAGQVLEKSATCCHMLMLSCNIRESHYSLAGRRSVVQRIEDHFGTVILLVAE